MTTDFDDIVVGGGASGAVLAARLSEDPARRVLLLEAGDCPGAEAWPAALRDADGPVFDGFNWPFSAQVRSGDGPGDAVAYRPGRVIGGSSSTNSAIALRPLPGDFADWGPDWAWPRPLPFLRMLERDLDFGGPLHGQDGPLPVSRPRRAALHPVQQAFHDACLAQGLPALDDLNAGCQAGVGPLPSNTVEGRRISVALAYLQPARGRPNLTVLGGHRARRVLFEGPRAVGVEAAAAEAAPRRFAGHRVTLCAGAVNTPALLLRSGVGDAAQCGRLGIETVAHLPGVGQNLADHPSLMFWIVPRGGAEPGSARHQVAARIASRDGGPPDLGVFCLSGFRTEAVPVLRALLRSPVAHGLSLMLARPRSRGRVTLDDAQSDTPPRIELNLGGDALDVERLMAGARLVWRLLGTPEMRAATRSVFSWSDAVLCNDAALRSAVLRRLQPAWHAVGTARMGLSTDPMAVVDHRFRVHRTDNLFVADASLMPSIPSSPTHMACIMLAERAAAELRLRQSGKSP